MAQQTLSNGISGSAFRTILNENFSDLYTNKADKNHASSTTAYGVATASNYGHIKVTTGNGLNLSNGTLSLAAASKAEAEAGTSTSVVMNPARVKDAINALSLSTDGNIILKISDTQPSAVSGKTVIWIDTSS